MNRRRTRGAQQTATEASKASRTLARHIELIFCNEETGTKRQPPAFAKLDQQTQCCATISRPPMSKTRLPIELHDGSGNSTTTEASRAHLNSWVPVIHSKEIAELKRQLANAEQRIIEGQERINRQRQLIGGLRNAGRNTVMARRVLGFFEESQRFVRAHRDYLATLLDLHSVPATASDR